MGEETYQSKQKNEKYCLVSGAAMKYGGILSGVGGLIENDITSPLLILVGMGSYVLGELVIHATNHRIRSRKQNRDRELADKIEG